MLYIIILASINIFTKLPGWALKYWACVMRIAIVVSQVE